MCSNSTPLGGGVRTFKHLYIESSVSTPCLNSVQTLEPEPWLYAPHAAPVLTAPHADHRSARLGATTPTPWPRSSRRCWPSFATPQPMLSVAWSSPKTSTASSTRKTTTTATTEARARSGAYQLICHPVWRPNDAAHSASRNASYPRYSVSRVNVCPCGSAFVRDAHANWCVWCNRLLIPAVQPRPTVQLARVQRRRAISAPLC